MLIFGIDPGSERTGYGCIDSDGRRHRLVACGSLSAPAHTSFAGRLQIIHEGLAALLAEHRPACVAIENIFHAKTCVRAAPGTPGVALPPRRAGGDRRGTPAEIKRAVVSSAAKAAGRPDGERARVDASPRTHDAADALAIAICHVHSSSGAVADAVKTLPGRRSLGGGGTSWRAYRP
jgi:crossover junction endodeoxyribonuclease RuvC